MLYMEEARTLRPNDGPGRVTNLSELATLTHTMFHLTDDIDYLNQTISYLERAVIECEEDDPRKRVMLCRLVGYFGDRYGETADRTDIQNGI